MRRESMSERPIEEGEMPAESDFSKGARGLHQIPAGAKVLSPVSILKREIETNEALK
jgi:hypothetical protein